MLLRHCVKQDMLKSLENMFDFFNEFFQSELVKNNAVALSAIAILLLAIGAFGMWLYMSKFYCIHLTNENAELKKKYTELEECNQKTEVRLKEMTRQRDAIQKELSKETLHELLQSTGPVNDTALEQFIKKG